MSQAFRLSEPTTAIGIGIFAVNGPDALDLSGVVLGSCTNLRALEQAESALTASTSIAIVTPPRIGSVSATT